MDAPAAAARFAARGPPRRPGGAVDADVAEGGPARGAARRPRGSVVAEGAAAVEGRRRAPQRPTLGRAGDSFPRLPGGETDQGWLLRTRSRLE